jgi:intron-binding protein aquarius
LYTDRIDDNKSTHIFSPACLFSNNSPDERKTGAVGSKRKLRLHLDPAQYYQDMRDGVDCYEPLNLVVRRNAKENNFKAILQTIRELINTAAVGRAIPSWMHDVFLGYGNPGAANYRYVPGIH